MTPNNFRILSIHFALSRSQRIVMRRRYRRALAFARRRNTGMTPDAIKRTFILPCARISK